LGFHVLEALDRRLDGFEVGQHAAEPTLIDERNTRATGFCSDDLAGLTLGAHHQDGAAIGRELLGELHRVLEHRQRFFQVDDVNLVAMAKNEGGHLGVPEAGLVTEMDAGFQHFTHGDRHGITPKVMSRMQPVIAALCAERQHLEWVDSRFVFALTGPTWAAIRKTA